MFIERTEKRLIFHRPNFGFEYRWITFNKNQIVLFRDRHLGYVRAGTKARNSWYIIIFKWPVHVTGSIRPEGGIRPNYRLPDTPPINCTQPFRTKHTRVQWYSK